MPERNHMLCSVLPFQAKLHTFPCSPFLPLKIEHSSLFPSIRCQIYQQYRNIRCYRLTAHRGRNTLFPRVPLRSKLFCFALLLTKHISRLYQGLYQLEMSAAHFSRPQDARYTSNTEISAGETPDMREAWPTLSGLTSLSLERASRRSPLICA